MKNYKTLSVATLAGLTIGGLSAVGAVSAQGYGDSTEAPEAIEAVVEVEDTNLNTFQADNTPRNRPAQAQNALFQDGTEAEVDAEADADGEGNGRRGHRGGGCNLEAAAEAIGIEEADLAAALDNGDTIADVAVANGVAVDAVVDALVEEKAERIAEKVASERITQEEADEKLADAEAKITDRVNGVEDADEDA